MSLRRVFSVVVVVVIWTTSHAVIFFVKDPTEEYAPRFLVDRRRHLRTNTCVRIGWGSIDRVARWCALCVVLLRLEYVGNGAAAVPTQERKSRNNHSPGSNPSQASVKKEHTFSKSSVPLNRLGGTNTDHKSHDVLLSTIRTIPTKLKRENVKTRYY